MKNRARWFLAALGAIAILASVLMLARSPFSEPQNHRKTDTALGRRVEEENRQRLASTLERRAKLEPGRLEDRDRKIDESSIFPPGRKAVLKEEWLKAMAATDRMDGIIKDAVAELAEDIKKSEADAAKTPKAKTPGSLRLTVDVARTTLLPLEPLIVNIGLVNNGADSSTIKTRLDPKFGYLNVSILAPGKSLWDPVPLTTMTGQPLIMDDSATTLDPAAQITLQTELPLMIGVNSLDKTIVPGDYRLRVDLSLSGIRDRVTSDETAISVTAPSGDDSMVLNSILINKLQGFLGTSAGTFLGNGPKALPAALDQVESLMSQYSGSRYAPFLRAGFLSVGFESAGYLAANAQELSALQQRLDRVSQTVMTFDRPQSWPRAEVFILLAKIAERGGRARDVSDDVRQFNTLLPNDVRQSSLAALIDGLED